MQILDNETVITKNTFTYEYPVWRPLGLDSLNPVYPFTRGISVNRLVMNLVLSKNDFVTQKFCHLNNPTLRLIVLFLITFTTVGALRPRRPVKRLPPVNDLVSPASPTLCHRFRTSTTYHRSSVTKGVSEPNLPLPHTTRHGRRHLPRKRFRLIGIR